MYGSRSVGSVSVSNNYSKCMHEIFISPRTLGIVCLWWKVILYCCETTFLIIVKLICKQSHLLDCLIDSFNTWLCLHLFHSKSSLNCRCIFTLHVLHSICKACDNLCMHGYMSKSVRNILNDKHALMLGNASMSFTLTFAWNIAVWFLKLLRTGN